MSAGQCAKRDSEQISPLKDTGLAATNEIKVKIQPESSTIDQSPISETDFVEMEQLTTVNPTNTAESPSVVSRSSLSDALTTAFTSVKEEKARSALKHLQKMFQNVIKNPADLKHRRFRADNILIKKHVFEVPGMQAFLELSGWKFFDAPGKPPMLELPDPVDVMALANAEDLINVLLSDSETKMAPPKEQARVLCLGGCGFWGEPTSEGYCSVCHKAKFLGIKSTAKAAASEPVPGGSKKCVRNCGLFGSDKMQGMCSQCFKKTRLTWKQRFRRAIVKLRAVHRFNLGKRPAQKHKNRCFVDSCKRKLGILGIECRCGYIFCPEHRYPNKHGCTFDLKKLHQQKLTKDMPKFEDFKMEDKL